MLDMAAIGSWTQSERKGRLMTLGWTVAMYSERRKGVQNGERTQCWSREVGDTRGILGLHARVKVGAPL